MAWIRASGITRLVLDFCFVIPFVKMPSTTRSKSPKISLRDRFITSQIPEGALELCNTEREKEHVKNMIFAFLDATEFVKVPRLWQLRAALCLLRRKDLLVIAGTSAGKTAAMCLALYVLKNRVALFIEPLISLQNTMVSLKIHFVVKSDTHLDFRPRSLSASLGSTVGS